MTLKNLIEMRQMTLNDTKFDIKKTLDTLKDDITDWIVLAIAEKIQIKD